MPEGGIYCFAAEATTFTDLRQKSRSGSSLNRNPKLSASEFSNDWWPEVHIPSMPFGTAGRVVLRSDRHTAPARIPWCLDSLWKGACMGSGFRFIVNPRKLEHGFRTISAGISYTLP